MCDNKINGKKAVKTSITGVSLEYSTQKSTQSTQETQ